ncbi:MAG: tetratricopeptide repeat protein [Bacteroidales bacterium]|nr:tetratricopeptide repeat protein [Bacteroidales bacterium]
MQKHILTCILLLALFACNRVSDTEKYDNLPVDLAQLRQAIDKDPHNADLYRDLSLYYIGTHELDSALSAIGQAIRMDSANDVYYETLSDVYFAQTKTDEAEEALDKALLINHDNNNARLKLAELHFLLKRYKLSQETAQQAIMQTGHNPKAYFILAWNYREQGDTASAIRNYLIAADQDAGYYDAYMELGILYQYLHNALAVDYYNNALNCRPDDFQALYNLGMYYQEQNEYEKALGKYKMILQNDPDNKFALHNMGWNYLATGKYEEASVFFSKAIEQDETYIEAIYNRGLAFEMLQKYNNARQDYLYCLKLQPNYDLAIESLNRLDKMGK